MAEITYDMDRIVNLPITIPVTPEQIEELSREVFQVGPFEGKCPRPNCHTCYVWSKAEGRKVPRPLRLFPEQAADLITFRTTGRGLWGNPVGTGKSATCQIIAMEALKIQHDARILLLIPSSVTKQFAMRDIPWARTHLAGFQPTWKVLHGKSVGVRRSMVIRKQGGVYVMPFSLLSQEDSRALLEMIDPDMIIVDEAQHLRGNAAMQRRFWSMVDGYSRRGDDPPAGVAMSGTLQVSSPQDYHPVARWTLGELSPLPRLVVECQNWAAILRSGSDKKNPLMAPDQYELMLPLLEWARRNFPEHAEDLKGTSIRAARTAYKLRFRSCPGVVPMTEDVDVIPMSIQNLPAPDFPRACKDLLDAVKVDWLSPDGRVLTYSLEQHQVMSQLSAGFYLKHYWPESHPKLREAKACFKAREEYFKALRGFLTSGASGRLKLDTPKQVGRYHADKGEIKGFGYLYDMWKEWHDLMVEGMPEQLVQIVLIDDFKIRQSVTWAKKYAKPGGIIWCEHKLFGDLVAQAVAKAGMKVLRKDAGASWIPHDGSGNFVCVADRRSHYEGKNLQYDHQHQLMLQWVRPQAHLEQMLGRLNRRGQAAESLICHTSRNCEFDHQAVAATLLDTVYDVQTMGGNKKLLLADWDPMPLEYPPDFLREQGFRLLQDRKSGDEDSEGEDSEECNRLTDDEE